MSSSCITLARNDAETEEIIPRVSCHPPIFGGTHNPTLLAFGWGIIATWWVGLPLGCLLAFVSRHRSWPKRIARDLLLGLLCVLGVMALCALLAGIVGFQYGRALIPDLTSADPHLNADLFSHTASYFVGGFGGLVLSLTVVVQRWKAMRRLTKKERLPAELPM